MDSNGATLIQRWKCGEMYDFEEELLVTCLVGMSAQA